MVKLRESAGYVSYVAQLRGGVGQDSLPFFIIRRNALPPTPFLHQTDGIASYAAQRGAGAVSRREPERGCWMRDREGGANEQLAYALHHV